MVSIEDIRESADSWSTVQKPGVRDASDIRKKTFYIIYYQLVILYGIGLYVKMMRFPLKNYDGIS